MITELPGYQKCTLLFIFFMIKEFYRQFMIRWQSAGKRSIVSQREAEKETGE